ncbi:CLUMA_CG006098, isoform A [Clunio marinus]|uniref:CLUMA_CG006098, isoform A n=1 Tax=Clunio marinus TaxID=568069 RepID=A0A1J1I0Z0_9DIPT|nr:CLUMA_CG006098, isoform A [Clunio marinus]
MKAAIESNKKSNLMKDIHLEHFATQHDVAILCTSSISSLLEIYVFPIISNPKREFSQTLN